MGLSQTCGTAVSTTAVHLSGRQMATPREARELDDVALRLAHLDALGIDIQVLHNTLWIEQVARWPETEVALCWL